MSTIDRGVDADRPVDLPSGVRLGEQRREDLVPGAVPTEAGVTLPDRLPWAEPLGHVPPRAPSPEPKDDALHHLAVIPKWPGPARDLRHHRCYPLPLGITDLRRATHPPSITATSRSSWETRPRPLSTRGQSRRDHFFHRTPHSHPGGLESLNHLQAKHTLASWAREQVGRGARVDVNEEEWAPDVRRRPDDVDPVVVDGSGRCGV